MGCFIACFGSSNHQKGRRHISPNPHPQIHFEPAAKSIFTSISQSIDETEKQSNGSIENKVQFYSDADNSKGEVQNYPIGIHKEKEVDPVEEDIVVSQLSQENRERKEEEKEENQTCSDSSMSSMISYPPMHRYHNCTINGDADAEEFEAINSKDDHHILVLDEESSESLFSLSIESRKQVNITETEEPGEKDEVSSPFTIPKLRDIETNSVRLNENGDVSKHIHSVLSPVENINQWKAVKSTIDQPTLDHTHEEKENVGFKFCDEPSLKLSSNHNSKHMFSNLKPQLQEPVVDASLSTWLVGSAINTPVSSEDSVESQKGCSRTSFKERRILGALSVEEINQLSACSSTPRKKSPTCSGGGVTIIGTVGSYWDHTGQTIDSCKDNSGSPTKFTTDKGVKCSSTPFATRLDRSLDTEIA